MIRVCSASLACAAALCGFAVASRAVTSQSGDWTVAGPFGGTARSISLDLQKPNVLLAGGMNSLVFRSEDAGGSWQQLNFPKQNLSEVTSLLVDPADSDHYLAGVISAEGGGLFESTDAGNTWKSIKPLKFGVRALTAAPSNPSQFVAGTLQGVWQSENSGKSWKRISDPENLEMQGITVVAVDSKDPQIIYAGTSHLPWKTLDGGKTWQSIHTGMIDDSDVFSIFIDPANPANLLASACSGIYASASRGDEWKKLLGIPNTSRRTHVIRQDPAAADTIYAGTTTGLFKSNNRGSTWKTLSDTQANYMVFDHSHPGTMYLALEYEGIGKSENGGETIKLVNRGFVDRSISDVSHSGDKLISLETQEGETSGIFTSSDRGESWTRMSDVHGLGGVHLKTITGVPSQPGLLLAATPHRLFKSADGGNLWKQIPVRLIEAPPPAVDKKAPPVVIARRRTSAKPVVRARRPVKPVIKTREVTLSEISGLYSLRTGTSDIVLAATDLGLLKSTDAGERWTLANFGANSPAVTALYLAPDSDGRLLARTSAGLFSSKDCGEHWEQLPFPLPASDVNQIAMPEGQSGVLLAATRLGLYSSADGGLNWSTKSTGLPASTVSSVLFAHTEGVAYAVEYGRLYRTSDAGASWKEVPTSIPTVRIRRLWMPDLSSGRLYGITGDLGILFRDGV